jgi:hypothetical protein
MTIRTKATGVVRSSLATALIVATLLAAAPAQAGGNVGFSFSFSTGNSVSHQYRHKQRCMSYRQIARGLSNHGYSDIKFKRTNNRHIKATAVRGRWVYSMRIDRCTGDVTRLKKQRRVKRGNTHSSGIHFQFSIR